MRINVPVGVHRKPRTRIERVNADKQVKAWWHVSNVNAVARMRINDHSWVHIQIVANIALKLLRQLTKHHVEPAIVGDYGYDNDRAAGASLPGPRTRRIGGAWPREGREYFPLSLAERKLRELLQGIYEEPDIT